MGSRSGSNVGRSVDTTEDEYKDMGEDGSIRSHGVGDDSGKRKDHVDPDMPAEDPEKGNNQVKGDPFGDETNADVKYRTMEWWQGAMIMIAETISLGILSLPSVFATIGMVPGVILVVGLGTIATYTGYVFWQFKMAYPHVHNIGDVGEILAGRIGKEIGGAVQTIFLIFIMGSHLLTWTVALNTITGHPTCTIVWSVVGLLLFWVLTIPRTLRKVSYMSIAAFISIVAAVMITMIGVGIEQPDPHIQATTTVAFASAFGSVTNIIFAYAGHVAFFSFISELKDPREFPKALAALQICDTSMYLTVGIVVYRYAGPDVASPALGSTGPKLAKIAYGIALPTIVIAGVIYGHVAAKYIYVRIFRGTKHMSQRTFLSLGTWLIITLLLWIVAWIIAESIPVFNNLVGLISALFASWFTYGLAGILWLYMRRGSWFSSPKNVALTAVNLTLFAFGCTICGVGLYASGKAIRDDTGGASWSCADNS